jgi:hypothetical protein
MRLVGVAEAGGVGVVVFVGACGPGVSVSWASGICVIVGDGISGVGSTAHAMKSKAPANRSGSRNTVLISI